MTNYIFPVSNGIFDHRAKIGAAIWTFLWLIDKTTKEVSEDGVVKGLVLGGASIPVRRIAADLAMEVRSVYDHIDVLLAHGYILRIKHGPGRASGFTVLKSKKRRTPEVLPQGTPEETRTDPTVKVHNPLNFSATHNRKKDNTRQYKETSTLAGGPAIIEGQALDQSSTLIPSPSKVPRLEDLVRECWLYYLEQTRKPPAQYLFNPERQTQGLSGLKALVAFAKTHKAPDPLQSAVALFRLAIDRLADSDFHNGKNEQGTKYLDWHQLFAGKNHSPPTKLVEFWLDDTRWNQCS